MKKKRLEGVLLAFAVAVSTVFAPVTVAGFCKGSERKTDRKTGEICVER